MHAVKTKTASHDSDTNILEFSEFDFIRKIYQKSLQYPIKLILSGKNLMAPLVVEMDITTKCNLSCPECISKKLLNGHEISFETLEVLFHDLRNSGTLAIIFTGGGEPLMHKAFTDIIALASDLNFHIGIVTNGTELQKWAKLLGAKVSWLRVSLDAASPKMFRLFRPSPLKKETFQNIIRGISKFSSYRKGKLGISFCILKRAKYSNIHDIPGSAQLAKDLGCDYIEYKPMMINNHSLVKYTNDEKDMIRKQLEIARNMTNSKIRILASKGLTAILNDKEKQNKRYKRCTVSKLRTLITPSGCYVCPYHRGDEDTRYCDSKRYRDFIEIWASTESTKIIESVDPGISCDFFCIRHEQNELFEKAIHDPDIIVNKKNVVEDFDLFF